MRVYRRKSRNRKQSHESAELRALLTVVSYVPRALRALVPHVPRALGALVPHVSCALLALVLHIACALRASRPTCSVASFTSLLTTMISNLYKRNVITEGFYM